LAAVSGRRVHGRSGARVVHDAGPRRGRLRRPRLPGAGRQRPRAGARRRRGPAGGQGLMWARVVTVERNTKPSFVPILAGMALTLKNMTQTLLGVMGVGRRA